MELYLLRHAIAVERGSPGIQRDSDRSLTDSGAKKMRRIARGMKALGLSFDVILSSPYRRACETAEIVAREFGAEKILELSPHLEAGSDARELVRHLADRLSTAGSALLVGHEPDLSELISILVSGDERCEVTMKKGGLCKLTVHELKYGRCAILEWLLWPRQMTLMR